MPDFLLRRNAVVGAYPDEFQVLLTLADGYELDVGGVRKDIGVSKLEFLAWSTIGGSGQSGTREEAMAALRTAWNATDDDLARMRRQQEWTEWKYVLWDAGYRDKMGKGPLRCACGEMFEPGDHEALRIHIEHINAATNRGKKRT